MLTAETLSTVTPRAVERLPRSAMLRVLDAAPVAAAELMAISATTLSDAAVTCRVI